MEHGKKKDMMAQGGMMDKEMQMMPGGGHMKKQMMAEGGMMEEQKMPGGGMMEKRRMMMQEGAMMDKKDMEHGGMMHDIEHGGKMHYQEGGMMEKEAAVMKMLDGMTEMPPEEEVIKMIMKSAGVDESEAKAMLAKYRESKKGMGGKMEYMGDGAMKLMRDPKDMVGMTMAGGAKVIS